MGSQVDFQAWQKWGMTAAYRSDVAPDACPWSTTDVPRTEDCGGDRMGAPRGSEDLYLCRRGAVDYSTDPQCISSLGSGDSAYSSHDVETALAYLAAERPQQEWQGLSRYRHVRELQAGSTAVVHLVEDKHSGKPLAIKLLDRSSCDLGTAREIANQRQCLMHPHIIQFREAFCTDDSVGVVMEYLAGSDMREYVETYAGPTAAPGAGLPEAEARWFFQQLVLAVDYCHQLGIAHRDIKLENVLLDRCGPRAILKLCDFGYASRNLAHPAGPVPCRRAVGTPEYMAPELLVNQSGLYDGKKADMWSMGVLLYVMLMAAFPFWRTEDDAVAEGMNSLMRLRCMMERILSGEYSMPGYLSPSCASLIRGMLTIDPVERLTMEDVMRHPWVRCDLPTDCFEVNAQLLAMPEAHRTAFCRQTEDDILHVVGAACSLL